jgi:hypothetical protein
MVSKPPSAATSVAIINAFAAAGVKFTSSTYSPLHPTATRTATAATTTSSTVTSDTVDSSMATTNALDMTPSTMPLTRDAVCSVVRYGVVASQPTASMIGKQDTKSNNCSHFTSTSSASSSRQLTEDDDESYCSIY